MRTAIVGGGAAGMAAAIAAARCGENVLLLERMDRVGKKLLATGNGRCNLMNRSDPSYSGGGDFAKAVLMRCGISELTLFFASIGLRLRTEERGRVYPASGQAATVLDAFRLELERLGVSLLTDCRVQHLKTEGLHFLLATSQGTFSAERVIVTGGGRAQPRLGNDGSCYALLTGLGHTFHPIFPALCQLGTERERIRGLSGIRVKTEARLERNGTTLSETEGEALFTDYGVSGICVMQLARYARDAGAVLHFNLLPAMGVISLEDLADEMYRRQVRWATQSLDKLFTGLCASRLGAALLRSAGIGPLSRKIASLTSDELTALCGLCADFPLSVRGVKGFDSAQVTAGGIAAEEFFPEDLASRKCPGLYAAGEVLDVDGDCGGFNLMFAFASGLLAGSRGHIGEILC